MVLFNQAILEREHGLLRQHSSYESHSTATSVKKSERFNHQSIYLTPVLNNMFFHIDLLSA